MKFQENLYAVCRDVHEGVLCSYHIITPHNTLHYYLLKVVTDNVPSILTALLVFCTYVLHPEMLRYVLIRWIRDFIEYKENKLWLAV